jgi:hypothetical protein
MRRGSILFGPGCSGTIIRNIILLCYLFIALMWCSLRELSRRRVFLRVFRLLALEEAAVQFCGGQTFESA